MSALNKELFKKQTATNLPPPAKRTFGRRREYTPLEWNNYFKDKVRVKVKSGEFTVYKMGDTHKPLLVLLHGGGYNSLTWSLFANNISTMVDCHIVAVDLRGHGETNTTDDCDLSIEVLASDVGEVINEVYDNQPPSLIVVGHSLGGAVAVHSVAKGHLPTCIGLVVIDVVEGTALQALQSMQSFLKSRPSMFKSMENAIEWCIRSGQVRNLESARVSMPGQLKKVTGKFPPPFSHEILEAAEEVCDSSSCPEPSEAPPRLQSEGYTWRIDLSKTEKFWTGWFDRLSEIFLECDVPKLLLLAGVDRLDKELTIGQMQGKFQMQVLPQSGHAVHEDVPDKVAECISNFLVRNKFAEAASDFHRGFPAC